MSAPAPLATASSPATGHVVPDAARDSVRDDFAALLPPRANPTHAEYARTLMAGTTVGTLATMAVDHPGTPFGSLVTYALDGRGRPLLCLSDIAEHARNMAQTPEASILVAERDRVNGGSDALALGRVTLLGQCLPVPEEERAGVREAFLAEHPRAVYADFADFRFWRLEMTAVRWVGGFGHMSWVDAEDYAVAEPDPLRDEVEGVLQHVNDDHADALVELCRHRETTKGRRPATTEARLTGLDRYGMDVAATTPSGPRGVRLAFPVPASTGDDVRRHMIAMLREARSA